MKIITPSFQLFLWDQFGWTPEETSSLLDFLAEQADKGVRVDDLLELFVSQTKKTNKHIYVPGIEIPGSWTGSPGTPGQPGQQTVTTNTTTTYTFSQTVIGAVTIEGDGMEKVPAFEGEVEGIIEVED